MQGHYILGQDFASQPSVIPAKTGIQEIMIKVFTKTPEPPPLAKDICHISNHYQVRGNSLTRLTQNLKLSSKFPVYRS